MNTHPSFRLTDDESNRSSVKAALNNYLNKLPAEKTVVVSITAETRTLKQNAYIWSGVYPSIVNFMRDHHGIDYSSDAIHETLKQLFLPFRVEQMARREIKIYRSTTKLTKAEFCEYVEHIMRWASEFGCVIDGPTWSDWRVNHGEAA